MTKILNQWGLGPFLDKCGHRCTQFVFQKGKPRTSIEFDLRLIIGIDLLLGDSGELIGLVKLHEQFLLQLMADFIFIQVCTVSCWII
jgi:salicylate hydroxylase